MVTGSISRAAWVAAVCLCFLADVKAQSPEEELERLRQENAQLSDLALSRQREIIRLKDRLERREEPPVTLPPPPAPAPVSPSIAEELARLRQQLERLREENRTLKERVEQRPEPQPVIEKPETVEQREITGTISEVIVNKELAMIDVGTRDGLREGDSLDVYRLDLVKVENSKYLGRLTVLKAEAEQAVGKLTPVPDELGKVRPGDKVGIIGE